MSCKALARGPTKGWSGARDSGLETHRLLKQRLKLNRHFSPEDLAGVVASAGPWFSKQVVRVVVKCSDGGGVEVTEGVIRIADSLWSGDGSYAAIIGVFYASALS